MAETHTPSAPQSRPGLDLFVISVLILFLELTCIRWFPAHVLFLTFFTNTVLLACFLGMSLGCLAAGHRRRVPESTPSGVVRSAMVRRAAEDRAGPWSAVVRSTALTAIR